jgi:hypothetical protein
MSVCTRRSLQHLSESLVLQVLRGLRDTQNDQERKGDLLFPASACRAATRFSPECGCNLPVSCNVFCGGLSRPLPPSPRFTARRKQCTLIAALYVSPPEDLHRQHRATTPRCGADLSVHGDPWVPDTGSTAAPFYLLVLRVWFVLVRALPCFRASHSSREVVGGPCASRTNAW